MAPNILRLRAYLDRITTSISAEKCCDACDAVMPGSTSTYPSRGVDAFVTPASASEYSHVADGQTEDGATVADVLDERTAMALEGGVSPAFARLFAALQVVRPASVDEIQWRQAIDDVGIFLDTWGSAAERMGWTAHDVIGPQFTPASLAWLLNGASVISLTPTHARLSDGRTFARPSDGRT
ncbi:hypothetical protein [Microvirga subterranea]|uniref:Uncharacterized protein n=1 Tax=Microvirga subterranea TaxID=186651 RepID=A0A370HWL3_9HYPH|nr:hypothetical protein [Microvirga subterranea]RDI62680.1 hypothetical protein DES45_101951 [Microvirga subterranea]